MQTRGIQIPSNLIDELGIPQILDITDEMPKLGKKGWDALESPRDINALTDIVWHHTAEFLDEGCTAETHANNHIKVKEGGMPYHFYIKDGQIQQCNDLCTFTYGVSSNNRYTIHCAVEGCYAPAKGREADILSDADFKAMIGLELTLRSVLPAYKNTNGHSYYKPTLCPGYSMTKFRESVQDTQNKLSFTGSEAGLNERAYSIANYITYLYNLAKGKDPYGNPVGDGEAKWSRQRLLTLEDSVNELKKG